MFTFGFRNILKYTNFGIQAINKNLIPLRIFPKKRFNYQNVKTFLFSWEIIKFSYFFKYNRLQVVHFFLFQLARNSFFYHSLPLRDITFEKISRYRSWMKTLSYNDLMKASTYPFKCSFISNFNYSFKLHLQFLFCDNK